MNKLWRAKLIAFSIHLLFSATLIGIFMWFVTQHWFPGQLFQFEDVWQGLQILVPVDAILGPLLTLAIFVPGKKYLIADLVIIVLIQISALAYGAQTIYGQRPEVIVFVGDRFEVVPASKYDSSKLDQQQFEAKHQTYPFLTYAMPAQSEDELADFVLNNTQYQKMPERYRPLESYRQKLESKALNIEQLNPKTKQGQERLESFKNKFNSEQQLLFIIEGTTTQSIIMALNKEDLSLQGFLDLDPWEEYQFSTPEP